MTESADKQFRVTAMLADVAKIADGKLDVFGGGWTVTGPGPCSFVITGSIEVPWVQTNQRHRLVFELIDLDGNPVTPVGHEEPLIATGEFEVGRPVGVRTGTGIAVPFVLPFPGPVQFPQGGHFEFRYSVNGEAREDWRLPFATRGVAEVPDAA